MKHFKRTVIFLLGLFIFAAYAKSSSEEPFRIRDLRTLGMGGAFTAVTDDANAFFYNPAAVAASEKTHLTVFQLSAGFSDGLLDGYNWYKDNKDELENMDQLKDDDPEEYQRLMKEVINTVSKLRLSVTLNTPQFSVISPGKHLSFGVGMFSRAKTLAKVNPGIILPTVDIHGRGDAVAPLTFGSRFLNDRLTLGFTAKYLYRIRVDDTRKTFLEMQSYSPTTQAGTGMGIDIGSLYKLSDKLNVGLAVTDFGGFGGTKIKYGAEYTSPKSTSTPPKLLPAYTGRVTPSMNAGLAYRMNDFLLLTLDIDDIWRTKNKVLWSTSLWPKLHAGMEFSFFNFMIGRLGINQGYPTFGLGLNLWLFEVEYARWGDELGEYSGDLPDWEQKLSLTFRYSWGGRKEEPVQKPVQKAKAAPPVPEKERTNIAVTDFEARAPLSASEAAFISDFIRSDLVNSGKFNVVEKNNMGKILAEQGFQNSGCSSTDCAAVMGKILNVKTIVVGSCGKLFGKNVVTFNAVDVETSKILYSDNISIDNPDNIRIDVRKMADRYAASVKSAAAPKPVPAPESPPSKKQK